VVFFGWQSETLRAANRRGIEAALRAAASQIEHTFAVRDLTIHIDKDTANRAGSPAIADTILEKIAECDVFVGDVTITNPDATTARLSPNANVLLELGYAAGVQGWDRVINVFNKACGHEPPALPFDLRHRRITTYTLTDEAVKASRNKADSKLTGAFVDALTEVIEKNPARPADLRGLSVEKIKERRDIENVTWLLRYVHWPTLEEYIEQGPKIRTAAVVDFFEIFESILNSTYFHLYDESLSRKIAALRRAWSKAMSHDENYETSGDGRRYIFTAPVNRPLSRDESADWNIIIRGIAQLRPAIDDLLKYIRVRFPSIDIKALSEASWDRYVEQQRVFGQTE
jgi:hypothetical protein